MSVQKGSKHTPKPVYAECTRCEAHTKHTIEKEKEWSDYYDGPGIHVWETYQIVMCMGCDTLSFRLVASSTEDQYIDEDGLHRLEETIKLYPERKTRSIVDELYLRDDLYDIPIFVQTIYRETLKAVEQNLSTLAGIGIRAVIEATCQDLKAKRGNLAEKIDELVGMSMLTPAGAEILHGIRLLGNDAAHEMKAPNAQQISAALKVIDHLLLGVYVLPQEASILPKPPSKTSKAKTKVKPSAKKAGSKK